MKDKNTENEQTLTPDEYIPQPISQYEYQMSDMGCLGQDCEELPMVVQVHWKDGHFNTERDVRIKFISTTGIGFSNRAMGVEFAGRAMITRWFAFRYGSECTMPDGTKFVLESDNGKYLTDGDRIRFKMQIVDWVDGCHDRCNKYDRSTRLGEKST